MVDPLHATIEEFAAEGLHARRVRTMSWLPKISMGLTLAQRSARLRCAKCAGRLRG